MPEPEPRSYSAKVSVLSTISVLTLLGNFIILALLLTRQGKVSCTSKHAIDNNNNVSFHHYIALQMTRMNYFLVHLSLADMLTALLTLLPEMAWTLTSPQFLGGRGVCKAVKFLQVRYKILVIFRYRQYDIIFYYFSINMFTMTFKIHQNISNFPNSCETFLQ